MIESENALPLVLVVDDLATNILVVSAALKKEYRVISAQSGEAALALLEGGEVKPDLILLDVIMPGLSGYDVLERVRNTPATKDIPVIFLTAETSKTSEMAGLELGADDYVTKPVVFPLLLARVRNIVQRERAKRASFAALRDQLEKRAKLDSLGKLVASFAHDINSPIANCLTTIEALHDHLRQLRRDVEANTLRRNSLTEFLASSETGMSLAQRNLLRAAELLGSFKQQALDQATSQTRTIALREWLDELLQTLRPMFEQGAHQVRCQVPADMMLTTQPGPLGQVVVNLVNNALIHGFDGRKNGTVTIAASQCAEGAEGAVELTVADDGAGMSPEVQARAFEAFFTTRADRGGTGLGLDIVHHIVEDMLGGTLRLHSAPGAGSCFTVRLPTEPKVG